MNKQELQIAIDKLTAMSEFALDLKAKLELNITDLDVIEKSVAPIKEVVKASKLAVVPDPVVLKELPPAQEDETVDLTGIIAEYELDKMKPADLKEYLDSYTVEYPAKAKKADLISILAQAIADGILDDNEDEDAPDSNEDDDEDAKEVNSEVITDPDFEASDERIEAEDIIEDKIRTSFPKKLKITAIKKFLKTYYDGDAEMADMDDFDDDQLLDMYIEIQRKLVDDDGDVHEMEEAYPRNNEYHCCGKECVAMKDSENLYCEVCGNEYDY